MNWKPIMRVLCHQKPERSYSMCGETLIVCSRCLGIYAGFLITVPFLFAAFGFFTKSLNFLFAILLLAPMGIDGVSQLFGMRESNNPLRFFTGYLAGLSVAVLVYAMMGKSLSLPATGAIPNLFSFAPLILVPAFVAILEKYNNSENIFLKKLFNFIAVFSAVFIFAALITLYAVALKNSIAKFLAR